MSRKNEVKQMRRRWSLKFRKSIKCRNIMGLISRHYQNQNMIGKMDVATSQRAIYDRKVNAMTLECDVVTSPEFS